MNNSPSPSPRLHPAVASLIVIVLVGMVGAAAALLSHHNGDTVTTPATSSTSSPSGSSAPSSSSTSTNASSYKNGSYSATVNYFTPDGQEPLVVNLTIANNTVTASSVSENAISGEGQAYFDRFNSYYQSEVVGQKVNDISLNRVAGASLTTDGFTQALAQIKQDAAS